MKKPYHHLSDGTFRNPEGSPKGIQMLNGHIKFLMRKGKIKINFPEDHVIPRNIVLKDLKDNSKNDYIAWIGHATFLIKLGILQLLPIHYFLKILDL